VCPLSIRLRIALLKGLMKNSALNHNNNKRLNVSAASMELLPNVCRIRYLAAS
jgi:hypothetical protein